MYLGTECSDVHVLQRNLVDNTKQRVRDPGDPDKIGKNNISPTCTTVSWKRARSLLILKKHTDYDFLIPRNPASETRRNTVGGLSLVCPRTASLYFVSSRFCCLPCTLLRFLFLFVFPLARSKLYIDIDGKGFQLESTYAAKPQPAVLALAAQNKIRELQQQASAQEKQAAAKSRVIDENDDEEFDWDTINDDLKEGEEPFIVPPMPTEAEINAKLRDD